MSNFHLFISALKNDTNQGVLTVSDELGNKVKIQPDTKTAIPPEYKWEVPAGNQDPLILKAETEISENAIQLFFTISLRITDQIEVHASSEGKDKSIIPIAPTSILGTPLFGTLVMDPNNNLVIVGTMELEDIETVGQA